MSDPQLMKEMSATTCWIVGQEIVEAPSLRAKARELLEKASKDTSIRANGLQYSPNILLISIYAKDGIVSLQDRFFWRSKSSE